MSARGRRIFFPFKSPCSRSACTTALATSIAALATYDTKSTIDAPILAAALATARTTLSPALTTLSKIVANELPRSVSDFTTCWRIEPGRVTSVTRDGQAVASDLEFRGAVAAPTLKIREMTVGGK